MSNTAHVRVQVQSADFTSKRMWAWSLFSKWSTYSHNYSRVLPVYNVRGYKHQLFLTRSDVVATVHCVQSANMVKLDAKMYTSSLARLTIKPSGL